MASHQEKAVNEEEAINLLSDPSLPYNDKHHRSSSTSSNSSISTTSLVLERISERVASHQRHPSHSRSPVISNPYRTDITYADDLPSHPAHEDDEKDAEPGLYSSARTARENTRIRRGVWGVAALFIGIWIVAAITYSLTAGARERPDHDHAATTTVGHGKKITLEEVLAGQWRTNKHAISWIEGANGEDGLLLEQGQAGKDYLVVEDVRSIQNGQIGGTNADVVLPGVLASTTLMKKGSFVVDGRTLTPYKVWPSKDLKKVLIATDKESNWRHSFYAKYWIFDVESQSAQALDPANLDGRIQLASWSPQSDAVVFTRDNNMFLRKLAETKVTQITKDGGSELFYGVPDWVYEEEVFSGNSATWWAEDGKYVAFMRTDESAVPEYPVEYFLSRPSGKKPEAGLESYPEVREIKYPKAGAPNPVVKLQFYDVAKGDVFEVKISDEFAEDDRLINEVVWAGATGKVLIKETNRESDILRVVLVDVNTRTGKTVRKTNIGELDGGWFEVSEHTRYVPADPSNGRAEDGYIDTVIHDGYDHLAYFSPLNNPSPKMLTSGAWEVVTAPSSIDLDNNLVYFVATKESSLQRHVYSVKIDGTGIRPLTDIAQEGYYDVSFSSKATYALLSYDGPSIPWQRVISTHSTTETYMHTIEENKPLADAAKKHEMPIKIYSTVDIDGYTLNVVERRPPHFDSKKKYPVLFMLYGGPGSQQVDKKFTVDFQSYVASSLGYIVVTVDGRGTGFIGRAARCIIRGNIGYYEARDQIETAKMWAAKKYVDASRMAIWGWSYGGYMTLKTLEQDAGQTFSYGMAVAPVTDWRFYDSIYTERYMHTPQHNADGYTNSSIHDMDALRKVKRFLVMHGVADDNVHMQSTLTLVDKLDLAVVENYDMHMFPDSDHGIYFHGANRIVYDKLSNWLINAFNGEFLKMSNPVPLQIDSPARRRV